MGSTRREVHVPPSWPSFMGGGWGGPAQGSCRDRGGWVIHVQASLATQWVLQLLTFPLLWGELLP